MSKRKVSDWLTAYMEYCENTEPPKSYHVWTAMSVIASALGRKVYMDWNFQRIFPNMYVVLVGPSGRTKKGTAMSMGRDIMKQVTPIVVTANSTTRESLIKQMERAEKTFQDPDGRFGDMAGMVFHNSLTCISDELSVFLGQNDVKFLANLTDWYDCIEDWKYETVSRGEQEIKGICLNILAGTAPDWFQSILPEEAIGGGFTSRIFFIVEERKAKTVAKHIPTKREKRLKGVLVEDLERINSLKGYYEFTEDAEEMYIGWYEGEDGNMNRGVYPIEDPRFAGYSDRRATHVKKLCMILAASRSDNLIIEPSDFERAKDIMEKAEVNMAKAFSGLGQSDHIKVTEKIIRYLQDRKKANKRDILIAFYRDMDINTWEMIKSQLKAMKYIKVTISLTNLDNESYEWVGPKR